MSTLSFELQDEAAAAAGGTDAKYVRVGLDTRLDNRWIDLRTPANQAIMTARKGCTLSFGGRGVPVYMREWP